jgi:hypothetical protein
MNKKILFGLSIFLLCFFLLSLFSSVEARNVRKDHMRKSITDWPRYKPAQEGPEGQQRVHRVGNVYFCITNWGFFGSQTRELYETIGGCFNPNPEKEVQAPSFEMPPNSGLEYLFQGALWIGAIVESETEVETLVTVGADGWWWIYEMAPVAGAEGAIIERSTRSGNDCYSPDAVSEQDIIAVFNDTVVPPPLNQWDIKSTDWDERDHRPLGVEIIQKSYSWSYAYAEDFVLIDMIIKNVNAARSINNMWVGLYIDADVNHISENPYGGEQGAQDDLSGFIDSISLPSGKRVKMATAYVMDNDGQPKDQKWTPLSPRGVSGVRVVRAPQGVESYFNWWTSNGLGYPRDWGPWLDTNRVIWEQINPYAAGPKYRYPDNAMGTPGGDRTKYAILSNREWDYDQCFTTVYVSEHPDEGWMDPPDEMKDDLCQGFDTRYLFSFGEFEKMEPGDSVMVTVGYIGGENLHVDPTNRVRYLPKNPHQFYNNLDFSDFATNSLWAAWVYDNPLPGEDTGDGIPDFKGPPPPLPPELTFETSTGKIKIIWNGKKTESDIDPFTFERDFEGYKIYMSTSGLSGDWMLLEYFDKGDDYKITLQDRTQEPPVWLWREASISLDSLRGVFGMELNPDNYTSKEEAFVYVADTPGDSLIFLKPAVDTLGQVIPDSFEVKYIIWDGDSLYFEKQGWNLGMRSIKVYEKYADSVDQGLIPESEIEDRYWDYHYEVTGLLPSQPYYLAVTTFDVGHPATNVPPLESGKSINQTLVYALDSPDLIEKKGSKVVVYPNPYRDDQRDEYVELGSEPFTGQTQFDRRIHFINLPAKCTIRIFTLDGDLVRTIEHEKDESDPTSSHETWDLISRNTQAVVSGIYLFSVESDQGSQVGKFVIIK